MSTQSFEGVKETKDYQKLLDTLKAKGVNILDVAQLYGAAEQVIGELKALDQDFTVDTKWLGGWPGGGWSSKDNIINSANESFKKLGVVKGQKDIDVFYIHSPDVQTPVEETLAAVDEVYKSGGFKRFGLSNFTPDQVREVLQITKEKGYVKPSVYQGSYAAVARRAEAELFPLLRDNGLAFYAYSPIAGGFLTKDRKFVEDQQGRFAKDSMFGIYHKMYKADSFLAVLDEWNRIANEQGVSKAELAYRWINYHSALRPELGDAIIFGATKLSQVESTTQYLQNGPLKEGIAEQINRLWDRIKDDAFTDNFQAAFGGSN